MQGVLDNYNIGRAPLSKKRTRKSKKGDGLLQDVLLAGVSPIATTLASKIGKKVAKRIEGGRISAVPGTMQKSGGSYKLPGQGFSLPGNGKRKPKSKAVIHMPI